MKAEIYLMPQFHRVGGQWKAIDATVSPRNDPDHPFSAEGAIRPVRFGRSASQIVQLALDNGPVTVAAPSLNIGSPRQSGGGVVYTGVATDTDLSYRVDSGMVKEEFILRSAKAPHSFSFHINDTKHQLGSGHAQADGSYAFDGHIDDASVTLAAPYAFQQGGPQAGAAIPRDRTSAHMVASPTADGTDVSVSLDDRWLAGKAFPVVLDPPITMSFSDSDGTMLAGSSENGINACGTGCGLVTNWDLFAGNGINNDGVSYAEPIRSYYRFDLSKIPLGATVSSAALAQYLAGCEASEQGTQVCNNFNYQIDLHHMAAPWSTSSSWADLTAATGSVDSSVPQPAFSCGPCGWQTWDLTALTQKWLNLALPNYGFDAQLQTEGYGRGGMRWAYRYPGNTYPHPFLGVTYTPPPASSFWGAVNRCQACLRELHWGQPVNTDIGNFWHTFNDMSIPGRGIPFNFSHTYNSLGAGQASHMGFGWSSSYDMNQTSDSSGNVTVHQENGGTVTFTPVPGGYAAPSDDFATLVRNADGTLTFTRKDKTAYVFAATGPVIKEIDRNGYVTTIGLYNNAPQTVTDPAGRTVTFSIDSSGRIQGLTDPAGRTVGFGYDANGDLTAITDIRGKTTTITYYAGHLLQTMKDPNGGVLQNYYDANGRVFAQYDPMLRLTEFSYAWGVTAILDPNGKTTVEYYTNHSLVKRTREGVTWAYTRDPATQAVATVTDPNGGVTTNTWDTSGNRRSTTDPIQRTTMYTYNAFNEVATETDPLNVTTTNIYDGSGNLRSTSRPLTSTGQTATTTYTYGDPAHPGDVTAMTDATSKVWRYTYDQYGNRTSTVDPLGNTTTYGYDGIGRMTSSVSPKGNVAGGNPAAYTTIMSYDPAGHELRMTDPLGHSTGYTYDNVGNRTSVTDANSHQTITTYDLDNEVSKVTRADGTSLQTGYDMNGNMTSQTDGLGRKTAYTYDAQNHQASMTDPLSRTTGYVVDAVGNLREIDYPTGQVTHQAFDLANQRYQITYGSATTHDVGFSYDNDGQQTGMDDGIGHTTWVYDSLHRRTQSTTPTGQVLYGHDLKGQLTSVTYPNGQTATRGYDDAGRLSSVSDWLGHTTSFGHDQDANLTTEAYPNTTQATLGYDAADRLLSMAHSRGATGLASFGYGRDSVGQLTSTTVSGISQPSESYAYTTINQLSNVNRSTYGYDGADNITLLASGATLSYDAANEVTSLSGPASAAFAYDSRGERTGATDVPQIGGALGYGYDQAGRLIQASRFTGTVAAGGNHSLAAATDGSVWTWGSDETGELGNGTVTNGSSVAAHLTTPGQVVAVSAGSSHDLALRADGKVWGWGSNLFNQLGNSAPMLSTTPVQVSGLFGVTAIAAGGDHNLALKSDGTVWTWGYNVNGELGHGTSGLLAPTALGPVPGLPRIVAIGAGTNHSMAVAADGTVWTWGINTDGELGNGTTSSLSAVPVHVGGGLSGVVAVAGGARHSLALTTDGTVMAWGYGADGELGNGAKVSSTLPVQVTGLTGAVSIAAGKQHSLAIRSDGTGWAWGYGNDGELGNGGQSSSAVPVRMSGLSQGATVAGGDGHSLAVRTDGTVQGWGSNTFGQIGPNAGIGMTTMVPVGVSSIGRATNYGYDGNGLRSAKSDLLNRNNFVWDQSGPLPLLLQDASGSYIYGPGGQPVEQIDSAGTVSYFHQDQLGSTRALTDGSGNVAATYTYDSYGNLTSRTGTVTTPLQFAGEYTDAETGFQYLRARYYDPATAQFLSRDPAVKQTRQPYGYVGGNPLNRTDPNGLWYNPNLKCAHPYGPYQAGTYFVCDASGNETEVTPSEAYSGTVPIAAGNASFSYTGCELKQVGPNSEFGIWSPGNGSDFSGFVSAYPQPQESGPTGIPESGTPGPTPEGECPPGKEWGMAATWPVPVPACVNPAENEENNPHAEY